MSELFALLRARSMSKTSFAGPFFPTFTRSKSQVRILLSHF